MSKLGKFHLWVGVGLGACFGLCWWWAAYGAGWFLKQGSTEMCLDAYQKNARTPIFSGFITMGSFLLALKTNILARVKESYDTPEYLANYRSRVKSSSARYYGSLEELGTAIGVNVILCLITAFAQMTFGFVETAWAFGICCGLATGCLFLLLYLTRILMSAHQDWFNCIENEKQKKIEKFDAENERRRKEATRDKGGEPVGKAA